MELEEPDKWAEDFETFQTRFADPAGRAPVHQPWARDCAGVAGWNLEFGGD